MTSKRCRLFWLKQIVKCLSISLSIAKEKSVWRLSITKFEIKMCLSSKNKSFVIKALQYICWNFFVKLAIKLFISFTILFLTYIFKRSSYSIRLSMNCVLIRFFSFSIVLSLERNFSKAMSISNRFCFCFLYILMNWWKFFKAIKYLFRSIRKSLNSLKKSLKWLLIHHFNWRIISMFKECVASSFSFDTTSDVRKNWRNLLNESWILSQRCWFQSTFVRRYLAHRRYFSSWKKDWVKLFHDDFESFREIKKKRI